MHEKNLEKLAYLYEKNLTNYFQAIIILSIFFKNEGLVLSLDWSVIYE